MGFPPYIPSDENNTYNNDLTNSCNSPTRISVLKWIPADIEVNS